jgi:Acetoacetate decarboxylase (ADC)
MLTGSAPLYELVAHAATMPGFGTDAVTLPDAEVFQAMFEMHIGGRETSLPPGLHPTGAPTFVLQVWRCPESPWGSFSLAQGRVGARSGLRPRGHVQGCVCDNEAASAALRERWGFPVQSGSVTLHHHYDAVEAGASVDGDVVVSIRGRDPEPLGNGDIAYSSSVALAHTPRGLRLVQIEYDVAVTRAERLRPHLDAFDAVRFGMHSSVEPYYPVSASIALGAIELHRLRFVCCPDELAFTGTEAIGEERTATSRVPRLVVSDP